MSNYDRYLTSQTNDYLDGLDDLDSEYEYAENSVRDELLDLAPDAKYGTYSGCDFCAESLHEVQPALLNALVRGDDEAILKLMYSAFEKEVAALVKYQVENQ
jgi:hypothetical protein